MKLKAALKRIDRLQRRIQRYKKYLYHKQGECEALEWINNSNRSLAFGIINNCISSEDFSTLKEADLFEIYREVSERFLAHKRGVVKVAVRAAAGGQGPGIGDAADIQIEIDHLLRSIENSRRTTI